MPDHPPPSEALADARRRFDASCEPLRPDLHRFCTRMTGDPCDGEDVLHEALVLAFYRLPELRNDGSFRAWVFRIAHNKCIDFLRARRSTPALLADEDEHAREQDRAVDDLLDHKQRTARALTSIVTELPPRERACVVLKDVLDWSLEETADITGVSVGAVKAALHRGRAKLVAAEQAAPRPTVSIEPHHRDLIERYLAAFNRRDWDGVLALLADDTHLEVVHRSEGPIRDACYFVNYGRLDWRWKLVLAQVDGVEAIVHFREIDGAWRPHSIVQLAITGQRVTAIRDFVHVDYLLRDCVVRSPVCTLLHDGV